MQAAPILSVIIPTYNEAQNIVELLGRLKTVLQSIAHEIIVVDDNSPDHTWEVAERFADGDSSVFVLRRFTDRGLSSAVVTGMSIATGRYLAVIDADLQHDETILPDMVRAMENEQLDLCIASRKVEGGSYGDWSRRRRFISFTATLLAKLALPVNVTDPMSGYFMIARDVFKKHADRINPLGFKILLEFIGRVPDLKIKEIGYTFRNRIHGETKLNSSVIRNYLVALWDLKYGHVLSATFVQYAFVGITGVFVNMGGFAIGELLDFPRIDTGLLGKLDPLYLSVPFGIQLSIFTNYLLNNWITFYEIRHTGRKDQLRGFLTFQIVSLFGLVVQTGIFLTLHNNGFLAPLGEVMRKYLNNAIGILIATVSNYYLNLNVTWKKR